MGAVELSAVGLGGLHCEERIDHGDPRQGRRQPHHKLGRVAREAVAGR